MNDSNNGPDELRVNVPFGSATLKSRLLRRPDLLLAIILALVSTTLAVVVMHLRDVREDDKALREIILQGISDLTKEQRRTTEAQQELNYIITLPQEKRERLNLDKPESLRRKLRPE